jgi:branched-chain amino acid transport system ATP-binding protein
VARLTCRFDGLNALDGLDLDAREGELLGVIGPNGAGKTTLFNAITGVVKPAAGEIRLRQVSLLGLAPHRIVAKGIARTFQKNRPFPSLTVADNLRLAGYHGGHLRDSYRHEEAIEIFQLHGWQDRHPGDLPWGVLRRLELARVYMQKPVLVLLDEPAAGLNDEETKWLATLLRQLNGEGWTIVLIEHSMDLVLNVSDRVAVLDAGRKIFEGSSKDLVADAAVRAAYLGKRRQVSARG